MKKAKAAAMTAAALLALAALLVCSAEAVESARRGLAVCARVIVPSLLPFFVLSALLGELGVPVYLGRLLSPVMTRLFGVSGAGASAFLLGVTGGYPLGASVAAELVRRGDISREEGGRLLAFCNNSGPAFIVGAAGAGIFGSAGWGLLLYLCHVLAAVTAGLLFSRGGARSAPAPAVHFEAARFSEAFPKAVRTSVGSVLSICGFVVTFTALVGVLDALGIFPELAGRLGLATGQGLTFSRALLTGLLELGSGIAALEGLAPSPGNLALCAFILGWGGLSVHFQTLAVTAGTGIKTARHLAGRLLSAMLSALYILALTTLF